MPATATAIDDDTDQDELIDLNAPDAGSPEDEDNGNGPTKAELEAENAARAAALKQVATTDDTDTDDTAAAPRMIPKGRFDEVNEERKALAAQLAQANAALAALATGKTTQVAEPDKPAAEFDLKAAMRERLQALASGDDDRALELDEAIQQHTLKLATENARRQYEEGQATLTAQQQAQALKRTAAELTALYPQLDAKSAEADEDAIDFVIVRRDKLMAAGKPAHEALKEAVAVAAKRFGFADDAAPTKDDPAAARLIAARTRNALAAAAQPPELGGKGNRATQTARQDVATMTDEEFAALPEAEKKRLRGDV